MGSLLVRLCMTWAAVRIRGPGQNFSICNGQDLGRPRCWHGPQRAGRDLMSSRALHHKSMLAFDQSDPPVTVASGPLSRPVDVTWAVHHDVPDPTDVRPAVRPGRGQTTAQCGKSADRDESHWHRGTVTDSEPILLVVLELRLTQSDREHLPAESVRPLRL
jgi:hypothetical protein